MNNDVISVEELEKVLNDILKSGEYSLFAPVMIGKTLDFAEVSEGMEAVISDAVPYKSPKEVLFPQNEMMMAFNNCEVRENEYDRKTVIFGAKPCDAEALRILNEVFMSGKFQDTFFKRRFDNNVIIVLGCREEKPGCFCAERGIYKEFSDFCDILLIPVDGGYNISCISDKGNRLGKEFFGTDQMAAVGFVGQNEAVKTELDEALDEALLFDIIDWEKASEICQGCGICTFVCPTCHCFDIKDVSEKNETKRYRCWDSCMYPKFTLHASGHNPRGTIKERFRQRVLHKYLYIKKNLGYTACTGCGRCIRSCPAGMSIKKVILSLMEALP